MLPANDAQTWTDTEFGANSLWMYRPAPDHRHANDAQARRFRSARFGRPACGVERGFRLLMFVSKVTRRPFGVGTLFQFTRLRRAASLPCAHGRPAGRPLLPALSVAAFIRAGAFFRCRPLQAFCPPHRVLQDLVDASKTHQPNPFEAHSLPHQGSERRREACSLNRVTGLPR